MKIHPENNFWLEYQVDQDIMDYVKLQIELAKEYERHELVGHISSSLRLPDQELKLSRYIEEKAKELDYVVGCKYTMNDMWVNFQKKHEFYPIHKHACKLSFVLWVQVPYTYEDERKSEAAAGIAEHHVAGCFEFLYTTVLGYIDKFLYPPTENVLLIFPANLPHTVYPFYTSDETRISISGNLN